MPHASDDDGSTHRISPARLAEFRQQRFGLFIHWGLYALAARHKWVKQRERLTDEQYQPYFDHFSPDLFDPDAWAEAAGAGMRYMVLTTKHHDGFCRWDSALTDYSVAHTPHGKDLVGPIVDAFRARGLGVGFYHSLLDWHHPDFPIDGLHPARREGVSNNDRNIAKYQAYLHGQVEELLTRYGRIDTMWFDFSSTKRRRNGKPTPGAKGAADWRSAEPAALVRKPHADRLRLQQRQPVAERRPRRARRVRPPASAPAGAGGQGPLRAVAQRRLGDPSADPRSGLRQRPQEAGRCHPMPSPSSSRSSARTWRYR
jgi:alpha-L-fucosidase